MPTIAKEATSRTKKHPVQWRNYFLADWTKQQRQRRPVRIENADLSLGEKRLSNIISGGGGGAAVGMVGHKVQFAL